MACVRVALCWVFPVVLLCLGAPVASAHNPIVIGGGRTTADTAYEIEDVDVSRVAYFERKESQPEIWLTFDAAAGTPLFLQMGVPVIDRYADYRPAMALVGPGLPEADVPFDVPDGCGAVIFPTAGVTPETFYEAFTGTKSWQFPAHELTLATAGRYYVVGYSPEGIDGKFWIASGKREAWGLADILSMPSIMVQVRVFHEVFPLGGLLFWFMLVVLFLVGLLFLLIL